MIRSFVIVILLYIGSGAPFAQGGLPTEVQADLLKREIYELVKSGQAEQASGKMQEYRALGVEVPPQMVFMEAKIQHFLGNNGRSMALLEDYLSKADRESKDYTAALSLYQKVKSTKYSEVGPSFLGVRVGMRGGDARRALDSRDTRYQVGRNDHGDRYLGYSVYWYTSEKELVRVDGIRAYADSDDDPISRIEIYWDHYSSDTSADIVELGHDFGDFLADDRGTRKSCRGDEFKELSEDGRNYYDTEMKDILTRYFLKVKEADRERYNSMVRRVKYIDSSMRSKLMDHGANDLAVTFDKIFLYCMNRMKPKYVYRLNLYAKADKTLISATSPAGDYRISITRQNIFRIDAPDNRGWNVTSNKTRSSIEKLSDCASIADTDDYRDCVWTKQHLEFTTRGWADMVVIEKP